MTAKIYAPRGADLTLNFAFPENVSFLGYDGAFSVYSDLNGTILLTFSTDPSTNGSQLSFTGNNITVSVKKDDIDALPTDPDDEQNPSVLFFDFMVTSPADFTSKIYGGAFIVKPFGASITANGNEIDVSLDGQVLEVTLEGGTSYTIVPTGAVRFDVIQSLSDIQKARVRENSGINADLFITQAVTDGLTTQAPSSDAVYDEFEEIRATVELSKFVIPELLGATGDDSTDDYTAIAAAITASATDRRQHVKLNGSVGSKFILNSQLSAPPKANLLGNGFRLDLFATDADGTRLKYNGTTLTGTNAFVTCGSTSSTPKFGGSLTDLEVDANLKMPYAARITDANLYKMSNVLIRGGTSYQLEVTNSVAGGNVTGYLSLFDCFIYASGADAHGVLINGGGAGADGCTLSSFYNLRCFNYGNGSNEGHGLYIKADGMDNSNVHNYTHFTTSATAAKGYGVYMPNEGSDGNTGYWSFSGLCNVGGGFYVGRVGAAIGWTIELLNDVDRPLHNPVISGPGGGDIQVSLSISTRKYGPSRVHGYLTIMVEDMMEFIDYASGTLRTSSCVYAIAGTGTPAPIAGVTSGVLLAPSATTGNSIYMTTTKGNLRSNGRSSSTHLLRNFSISGGPSSGWAFSTHRAGFDGSNTAYNASTRSDAVFVECASTGSPGTLYLKVRKGGVETASVACVYHGTATPVGYSTDKLDFVLEVTTAFVRLKVRGAGQVNYTDCALVEESGGTIIPTVGMSRFASVTVDDLNFAASMILFEDKFAYDKV